ncbi:MAG TPA: hypothetical protein VGK24_01170 [Candidatus Angelobacter sp.]|jgi:hypothetical protein
MNSNLTWQNVLRVAWLTGGVVAINEPGADVEIKAGLNGKHIETFQISDYGSLFPTLRRRGFTIIGVTFVTDRRQLESIRPPEFRVMNPLRSWLIWEVKQQWRQIASAASTSNMPLMSIASRIASRLQYSQMRLVDLASAYSIQLGAYLHEADPSEYKAFQDEYCSEVYKAIHALFWEMAVLRDNLAEFAARFCFSIATVSIMSSLRNKLKSFSTDPLAREILEATDESSKGWLVQFSEFRNCFTHVAPMEQAAGIAFAVQDMRRVSNGLSIPQMYYALPQDIGGVKRKWAGGSFVTSFEELIATASRRHERGLEPDALEYLHDCINRFGELAAKMIARSPTPPKPIHITPRGGVVKSG